MAEAILKASLWIKAQIKICDINFLPIAVVHRGDPDAGTVLLKINRLEAGIEIFSQVRTANGALAWMSITSETHFNEADASAYIEQRCNLDPDIWVLEIEDPKDIYKIEGIVL